MKRLTADILIIACIAGMLSAAAGCTPAPQEEENAPYLEMSPETIGQAALGEGDAFLITIHSNTDWTLVAVDENGHDVDWIRLESTSGTGDAVVMGFILTGDREADRSCTLILVSSDKRIERRLSLRQEIFVPVLLDIQLSDIVKNAAGLAAGERAPLTDYSVAKAVVTGVPGGNLPEGYVYVTDNGSTWLRIQTDDASGLGVGDVVRFEMTGGTVTREANGGLTVSLNEQIQVVTPGGGTVKAAYISSDVIAGYENMLVELRSVQPSDSEFGGNWSGDTEMVPTDEEEGTFTVHVSSGAPFASTPVPAGNGVVRGIVIDGKVCPRSADDITLAGALRSRAGATHRITPVACFFKIGAAKNTFSNGSVSGATKFTFTDEEGYSVGGASIEKVGGTANKLTPNVSLSAPYNSCFTTVGWNVEGTYLLYTVPVREKIWGDLDFFFSLSCGTAGVFSGDWNASWSVDGITFKDVDAAYSYNVKNIEQGKGHTFKLTETAIQRNRQVLEFSIPEEEAVSSGNLYFKLVPPAVSSSNSAKTLRVNSGFILCSRTERPEVPLYDNVLAAENFSSSAFGCNPVVGVPIYYFSYSYNVAYPYAGLWLSEGDLLASRGCLLLNGTSGSAFIISPALDKLSGPTDVTVSFKAAPYVDCGGAAPSVSTNAISIRLDGSGTAGPIEWDSTFESDPYAWHKGTCRITGASSDTSVGIGVTSVSISTRAYLDDIVIKR